MIGHGLDAKRVAFSLGQLDLRSVREDPKEDLLFAVIDYDDPLSLVALGGARLCRCPHATGSTVDGSANERKDDL